MSQFLSYTHNEGFTTQNVSAVWNIVIEVFIPSYATGVYYYECSE